MRPYPGKPNIPYGGGWPGAICGIPRFPFRTGYGGCRLPPKGAATVVPGALLSSLPSRWNGHSPGPSCRLHEACSSLQLPLTVWPPSWSPVPAGWASRAAGCSPIASPCSGTLFGKNPPRRCASLKALPIPWRSPVAMQVRLWPPWALAPCAQTAWRRGCPGRRGAPLFIATTTLAGNVLSRVNHSCRFIVD